MFKNGDNNHSKSILLIFQIIDTRVTAYSAVVITILRTAHNNNINNNNDINEVLDFAFNKLRRIICDNNHNAVV